MNKTININLAGTFFHIDEDAYLKLQGYLDAIRRSFSDTQGRDEIISDIEARIAELFTEKMENDRQVISTKEVDAVIAVMGQPEDYLVDEEIFDDEPKKRTKSSTASSKKLYRDMDDKYIGGVCSGLGYYLGIDAVWVRLLFILFTIFSGFGLIAYILFWILAPEASTTSQKIAMTGDPVNISNIEKKVKEGFDNVAEKVKDVDYEKIGNNVKSGSKGFFDTLGDIIVFFFKIIAKFIGIILLITGAATLIGLFVGLFTVGIADIIHIPGIDFVDIFNTSGTPIWLASLITFFAVGIPFFFLFYLGLKILVNNLKSIGNIAKFSLLGLWLMSVVGLFIMGVRQASEHAYTGSTVVKEELYLADQDTLHIKMNDSNNYSDHYYRDSRFDIVVDRNDNERIYSEDVIFNIRQSEDSLAYINIRKEADGRNFKSARNRAENIEYNYELKDNTLILDDFLTTPLENKFRDQEIRISIYVPEGTVIVFDDSTYSGIGRSTNYEPNYSRSSIINHKWKMNDDNELHCIDCEDEDDSEEDETNRVLIDEEGIDIKVEDKDGDKLEMKLDENGLKIETT
ncbi:PspC domain-containing protein [Leptobacterium flavescens]|uniref:PspC domain-containing protein n=1 Tax=Leptobacterium flavescens TaxID=472055 RepID=A0A6P0UQ50_9FLAO|nr:PspC domain-containing protein [Leptobacterium flavescens]NER14108.1 PspC domain-containing protein [Leptobacterium flavescens]